MAKELEARVWCPRCRVVKYEVYRLPRDPDGQDGVYVHRAEPADKVAKHCECGAVLVRKP